MLDYSNKNYKGEIGYPRCDDLNELLSEIELYENTLEESIYIIYHENVPIALGGYLYTPGENEGYLIGPICMEEYYNKENLEIIIELMLNSKRNIFNKLAVVVSKNNILLNETYSQLGWVCEDTQREMCFDTDGVKVCSSKYSIKEIDKNNDEDINNVFKLFNKAFKWNGNYDRMSELLEEDYRLGCVVDKHNNISGAVSWAYLKDVDFSRLEYLVVKEDQRRKGIGEAMINYVINHSIDNNVKHIYLSTDINNNAVNLYKKVGFYDTIVSKIYEKSF